MALKERSIQSLRRLNYYLSCSYSFAEAVIFLVKILVFIQKLKNSHKLFFSLDMSPLFCLCKIKVLSISMIKYWYMADVTWETLWWKSPQEPGPVLRTPAKIVNSFFNWSLQRTRARLFSWEFFTMKNCSCNLFFNNIA